ncbi:T9SS type A sorting domain-containing protein [uncultured Parabacteroides sp.]|uniref:T9SS type A sorting domain-containing protein n=1 Tax=uncultured Parabacteroides sp. TaxID=512312 RepID=UPI002630ABCD|nr:T9SS type A sorting domain-containing protein [uncultured Parabacteroides sp.]
MALFGLVANGWGQTYTIRTQSGKTFPQENIPTLVDTVYVASNSSRTLTIGNFSYYYYFRWYQKNTNGDGTNITNLSTSGSNLLQTRGNSASYFWHWSQWTKTNVHQISYTRNVTTEDSVFCDVSFNVDGTTDINASEGIYTEPTIGKRYKFLIKPASQISDRLDAVTNGNAMETRYITVPIGATGITLQMPLDPESYYWNNSDFHGRRFSFSIQQGNQTITNRYSSSKTIALDQDYSTVRINQETTVEVRANTNSYGPGTQSPIIMRFILTPQEDSNFAAETAITNVKKRNPEDYPAEYQQIGVVDFDYGEPINAGSLTKENNMRSTPVDPSQTTYSFVSPNLSWISPQYYMPEDAYGLYRTANVENISQSLSSTGSWGSREVNDYGSNWKVSYYPSRNSYRSYNKTYGWYYANNIPSLRSKEMRDRTWHNSNQKQLGYFYYVNASAEPGRIVSIPLEGTLCAHTELTVTVWVADLSNASTLPNLSLVLRGEEENGETEVLHRFVSGEMERDGYDQATWKQLCYRITIDRQDLDKFTEYVVDIENNTPNSDGGDYAIDDIRIYKSLPNIQVQRENACDASTLIISTNYETILRNMGWEENQYVAHQKDENNPNGYDYTDLDLRKYRYGLMGEIDEQGSHDFLNSVVGNVYFSFLDENQENWISVSNAIKDNAELYRAAFAVRVPVSTAMRQNNGQDQAYPEKRGYEFYTTERSKALKNEQIMNYRAICDYNADIKMWQEKYSTEGHRLIDVTDCNPEKENFSEEAYQAAIEILYARLGIPRLRCPWYNTTERRLYLGILDVGNTDLRYQNEKYRDVEGNEQTASGKYWVVTFAASEVAGDGDGGITVGECTLMSEFTVYPATNILVQAETNAETALCLGAIRKITPTLAVYDKDTMEPLEDEETFNDYVFDWYLGPKEDYDKLLFGNQGEDSLSMVISAYRLDRRDTDGFTWSDMESWISSSSYNSEEDKALLKGLFDEGLIRTGVGPNETFNLVVNSPQIVAMPYVYEDESTAGQYVYCSSASAVDLAIDGDDIPDFYVGFSTTQIAENDSGVPLRLGRRHLADQTHTFEIPVRKALQAAEGVTSFGISTHATTVNPVYIDRGDENMQQVGTVTAMDIPITGDGEAVPPEEKGEESTSKNYDVTGTVTITWNDNADQYMREGKQYTLYIPFVQIGSDGVMGSQCDGVATLPVKIVPEYLTWKGSSSDKWYDDTKWNQSTKSDLYFSGYSQNPDMDANGTDNVKEAYSPLYFTKITVPDNKELILTTPSYTDASSSNDDYKILDIPLEENNPQYDMAVDTVTNATGNGSPYSIVPYYINKVNEIYLKPGATLMNQQRLIYDTARVELEMTPGTAYWMASPLCDVYAGDMYAPSENGRQTTPAFNHIIYNTTDYNRWSPAFYQKAWSRAIAYSNVENPYSGNNAGSCTDVDVVQSNWSIEYNDVWVPYTLGKGFYARVEDVNGAGKALVRLPKADTEYLYEKAPATRSLSQKPDLTSGNRTNAGKMAGDEEITVELSTVDGDGKHFLIGNPYMTYLDMSKFFAENTTLAKKYWTLSGGTSQAVVGTPDVGWAGNETGSGETLTGLIPPMTAFFVELNDGETTRTEGITQNVTFTTDMMAQAPAAETGTTRAYTASNPVLTLTAEREGYRSVATLMTSDKASDGYEASEDAVLLLDSELDAPMVYTVSGSVAAQVNAVKEISNVGLGIYNGNGDETTITISGINQLAAPLYLYDARTRESVVLEGESYNLRVSGDCHGRYYLRSSVLEEGLENNISIYSARKGEVIVSALRPVKEIKVFGVNGRQIRNISVNATQYQFTLPSGLYIICASDGDRELTEKVIVR